MANSIKNQKYSSKYPARFNKREGAARDRNNSLLISDADYSILADDGINYIRNSGANSMTLPVAAENKGRVICFLQADANILTIAQNADSANINGADADFADCDAADDFVELFCDGSEWIIVKQYIS